MSNAVTLKSPFVNALTASTSSTNTRMLDANTSKRAMMLNARTMLRAMNTPGKVVQRDASGVKYRVGDLRAKPGRNMLNVNATDPEAQ